MQKSLTAKNITDIQNANTTANYTMNELADRFVKYLDVSALSIKSYISGVRKFLTFLNSQGITLPTRDTVILYKKTLCEKYTANTTALYLSALRRFFSWCQSEGLYSDITAGIKSPHIDTGHKKDCFTANQLKTIIGGIERNSLKGKRDYALFCLISATGLRTVEIQRADISDIRNVQGENVLYIMGKGKTSKSQFVKLSGHVLQAIRAYLEMRGAVADDEPLFASLSHRNFGGRMTTKSISRICKSAMINAGFNSRRLTAHSLRHTSITLALLAGMSLQDVSQFARHSNISVTMIYSHDIDRLKSRCEMAISEAIFGA